MHAWSIPRELLLMSYMLVLNRDICAGLIWLNSRLILADDFVLSRPSFNLPTPDERLIPNPPTNLQFSEEIDKRVGFFGHAILNISWDGPQSMHNMNCIY